MSAPPPPPAPSSAPSPAPAPASAELLALRARTEQLLRRAAPRFVAVADRFEVPYQSTRIIVHPLQWTQGRTVLRFIAPVVLDVRTVPVLFERLSELNNTTLFGKFYLDDGAIWIEHNLLGESVGWEEFRAVLASVAHNADHLDAALIAEFGGRRWSEHA